MDDFPRFTRPIIGFLLAALLASPAPTLARPWKTTKPPRSPGLVWTVDDTSGSVAIPLDTALTTSLRASEYFKANLLPLEEDASVGGPGSITFGSPRRLKIPGRRTYVSLVANVRSCCVHRRRILVELDDRGTAGPVLEIAKDLEFSECGEHSATRRAGSRYLTLEESSCITTEGDDQGRSVGDSSSTLFTLGDVGLQVLDSKTWKFRR